MTEVAAPAHAPVAAPPSPAIWDIDDAHCTLLVCDAVGHRAACSALHYVQPGMDMLVRRIFRQRPPTPQHIERAILLVEGMLAPTTRLLAPTSTLLCTHPLVHELAQQAAATQGADSRACRPATAHQLHLECAEALLQRRLAQDPQLPQDAQWTAALVLAYEVMVQWEVGLLHLVPAPRA